MTIFNLYIFSRSGDCLYYAEWFRPVNTLKDMPDEDRKLMYGLIISLKHLMNKANPVPYVNCVTREDVCAGHALIAHLSPLPPATLYITCYREPVSQTPSMGPEQGFFRYSTDAYVLSHLETTTGYKFALTSDHASGDMRAALWTIYSDIFVPYALKNPLYTPGTPIANVGFAAAVEGYIKGMGAVRP
jgi:hypothetical protein